MVLILFAKHFANKSRKKSLKSMVLILFAKRFANKYHSVL
jgi:hypothetical protein